MYQKFTNHSLFGVHIMDDERSLDLGRIEHACSVPIGVNPSRYYRRFFEHSPRLFITHTDIEYLRIIRVLVGSRGKRCDEHMTGLGLMDAVMESCQVECTRALKEQITVSTNCIFLTNTIQDN